MGGKFKDSTTTIIYNPGPGKYEAQKAKLASYEYSMGRRLRAN